MCAYRFPRITSPAPSLPLLMCLLYVSACAGEVGRAPKVGGDLESAATPTEAGDDDAATSSDPGDGQDKGGSQGGGGAPTPPVEEDPLDPCGDGQPPLASGLQISEVAIYQAVKIPLAQNGSAVTSRNAPVIAGRDALLRVFVKPGATFQSRPLTGVLTLATGGESTVYTADFTPTGASTDVARGSTANFEIDGEDIALGTSFSVALLDKSCPDEAGAARDARFPSQGTSPLSASATGTLRVVVVPVRYNGDGSGRVPDTSPSALEDLRQALLAHYPVANVEVTARSTPLNWNGSMNGQGAGWSQLLDAIMATRHNDRPDRDVYYFGMVNPDTSFASYCGWGCVLGIAPQTVFVNPDQQAGLGVGFAGEQTTQGTMVHELGHAHGRGHAPCGGGAGQDRQFPYSDGGIGVWGYDITSGSLKNTRHKDIMGYCQPTWISDYTYRALAQRSQQVNRSALWSVPEGAPRWRSLLVLDGGALQWGLSSSDSLPAGQLESARVLDGRGVVVDEVDVVRLALSHSDDQILYLPDPEPAWAALEMADGRVLDLFDAAPAAVTELLDTPARPLR